MALRGIRAGLTALVMTAGLALSGCGIVGGPIAGSSERPTSSPSAKAAGPEAGHCHKDRYTQQTESPDGDVVDCADGHLAETVYIGRFESAPGEPPVVADVLGPDAVTGEAASLQDAAYRDCGSHADGYLGHSWLHPLVRLRLSIPTDAAWAAGDRWYRCDLYEVSWGTTAALRRLGSFTTSWPGVMCLDGIGRRPGQIDCAKMHPDEYAGAVILPSDAKSAYSFAPADYDPYYDECTKLIATYIGTTADQAGKLTGTKLVWQEDPLAGWSTNRVLLCFTWTGSDPSSYVTGSAKGRKGEGL